MNSRQYLRNLELICRFWGSNNSYQHLLLITYHPRKHVQLHNIVIVKIEKECEIACNTFHSTVIERTEGFASFDSLFLHNWKFTSYQLLCTRDRLMQCPQGSDEYWTFSKELKVSQDNSNATSCNNDVPSCSSFWD